MQKMHKFDYILHFALLAATSQKQKQRFSNQTAKIGLSPPTSVFCYFSGLVSQIYAKNPNCQIGFIYRFLFSIDFKKPLPTQTQRRGAVISKRKAITLCPMLHSSNQFLYSV